MIENLFKQLGFHENAAKVYVSLAELGKAPAQVLSQKIGIPRTTIYSVLEMLIAKGLVSEDVEKERKYFIANGPTSLERLIKSEEDELNEKKKITKELIEAVGPYFKSENFSIPRLQFFEGRKNVEQMLYKFTDTWNQSCMDSDKVWWGYQDPTVLENYTEWLYDAWKRSPKEVEIRLLSHPHSIEKKLKNKPKQREIRPLPSGIEFNSTIWVCGDYIIMVMTKQNPHFAFQIKDPLFAANHRTIFELLWRFTGKAV